MILCTKNYKRALWQRLCAGMTLFLFLTTQNFSAGGSSLARAEALPPAFSPSLSRIDEIQIPKSFGSIEESFQGTSGETIIVVQDAHSIPDAQKSIQRIIQYFQSEYGIRTIGLEGAASKIDPQIFLSFPDKVRLKKVLKEFLMRGELSGGAAAAIFSERKDADFYGVEDWNLYQEGVGLYQKALKDNGEIFKTLEVERLKLEEEKKRIYSGRLLAIDGVLREFNQGRGDLSAVIKKLAEIQRPQRGTELEAVLEEIEREGTDQSGAEAELRSLAEEIRKQVTSHKSQVTSEKLKNLNEKKQGFQTGLLSVQAFALFLSEFLTENPDLLSVTAKRSTLGALSRIAGHQKTLRDIEGTRFFTAFEAYARRVKESLMTSEDEYVLNRQSRQLDLYEKMTKLELTREEWEEMKAFGVERLADSGRVDFLNGKRSMLDEHYAFYDNAESRDAAFLKNLLNLQGKSERGSLASYRSVLLVAGGFHARGVTQRLKKQGISYLLVVPAIRKIPETTNYQAHMQGDVSWKNYFNVENGKVSLYKAFVRAVRDKLLNFESQDTSHKTQEKTNLLESSAAAPNSLLLKVWRDQIIRDLADRGKLKEAGQYTRYLDEKIAKTSPVEITPAALSRVSRFIAGLRVLKEKGTVNPANILNILKPSTAIPPAELPLSHDWLPSKMLGLQRSEVRSPQAGLTIAEAQRRQSRLLSQTRSVEVNEMQRIAADRLTAAPKALEYLNRVSPAPKINIYVYNQAFNGVYGGAYLIARELRQRLTHAAIQILLVNGSRPGVFAGGDPGIHVVQDFKFHRNPALIEPGDFNFVVTGSHAYTMPPLPKVSTVVLNGFRHDWDEKADPVKDGYPDIHMNFTEPHSTIPLLSQNRDAVSAKDAMPFAELVKAKEDWHRRLAQDSRAYFGERQWAALQDFAGRKGWRIGEAVMSWAYFEDKNYFQRELQNLAGAVSSGVFGQQEIWTAEGKQILIHASVSHRKAASLIPFLEEENISFIDFNGDTHEGSLPVTLVLHEKIPQDLLQELQVLSGTMTTYSDESGKQHWIGFPAFVTGWGSSHEAMSLGTPWVHCRFDISSNGFVDAFKALTQNVLRLHEGQDDLPSEISWMSAQTLADEFLMGAERRVARYDNLEEWSRLARWFSQSLYRMNMADDVAILLARQMGYEGTFMKPSEFGNILESRVLTDQKLKASRSEVRSEKGREAAENGMPKHLVPTTRYFLEQDEDRDYELEADANIGTYLRSTVEESFGHQPGQPRTEKLTLDTVLARVLGRPDDFERPLRVLDVGTGNGDFPIRFQPELEGLGYRADILAVDNHFKPEAQEKLGQAYKVLDFEDGAAVDSNLGGQPFDLIVMNAPNILSTAHATRELTILRQGSFASKLYEAEKILSKNGAILIRLFETPHYANMMEYSAWLRAEGAVLRQTLDDFPQLSYVEMTHSSSPDFASGSTPLGPLILLTRKDRDSSAQRRYFKNGLPVPAADGTSAKQLIRAFQLEDVKTAEKLEDVAGLTVFRIRTREGIPAEVSPQGSDLFRSHLAPTDEFELLYNSKNQLIAVFPVMTKKLWKVNYFDLSDYYPSWPRPGEADALEKWKQYRTVRDQDKALIEEYKKQRGLDSRLVIRKWNDQKQAPFIMAEVDLTARVPNFHASQFNPEDFFLAERDLNYAKRNQRERFIHPAPGTSTLVYMLYPTVYSPGFDVHVRQDSEYYGSVAEAAGKYLKDGDVDWDDATGSGIGAWLKYEVTKGKEIRRLASDINALAAANALQLAQEAGFSLEVAVSDTSRGVFPFKGVDKVVLATSNSGAFSKLEEKRDVPEVYYTTNSLWWDNDVKGVYLRGLSRILGEYLAENGIGITWNVVGYFDSSSQDALLPQIRAALASGGLDVKTYYDDSDGDGESTMTIELRKKISARSEVRAESDKRSDRVMAAATALVAGMTSQQRRITDVNVLWSLIREKFLSKASPQSVSKSSLTAAKTVVLSYFRQQGFPENISGVLSASEIHEGLSAFAAANPAEVTDFVMTKNKNHTLSTMLAKFRLRLPVEYTRNPSVRFVRYGRPSYAAMLFDANHTDNFIVFQIINDQIWVAYGKDQPLRKFETGQETSQGPKEVTFIQAPELQAFNARLDKPKEIDELAKQQSFGFAGFSIYLSAEGEQEFQIERHQGKTKLTGEEKLLRLIKNKNGQAYVILTLRQRGNDFSLDGVGWKHPKEPAIYPLLIGKKEGQAGKSAVNLNRIVDMVRNGELAKQFQNQGLELVVDSTQVAFPLIPSPEYLSAGAGGRAVKVSTYQLGSFVQDETNPWRFYKEGTIIGEPSVESRLPMADKSAEGGRSEVRAIKTVSSVKHYQPLTDDEAHALAKAVWTAIKAPEEMSDLQLPQVFEKVMTRHSVETLFAVDEAEDMEVVIRQVGSLVFVIAEKMTETALRALQSKLTASLEKFPGNIIFTERAVYLKNSVDLGYFTTHMIAAMINNAEAFQGSTVSDFGAGHGILSQVALTLGANHVMLADYSKTDLKLASLLLQAQGAAEDSSQSPTVGSFSVYPADFISEDGAQIIAALSNRSDIALVNIGPWTEYLGVNEAVMDVLEKNPRWKLLMNSGYRVERNEQGHKDDLNRSFELFSKPGFYPQVLRYAGRAGLSRILRVQRLNSSVGIATKSEVRALNLKPLGKPPLEERLAAFQKALSLPIVPGTRWKRLVTTEEADFFDRDFVSTESGEYPIVLNGESYALPARVFEKMKTWANLSRDHERAGYFTAERVEGQIRIIDFKPLPSLVIGLGQSDQHKTTQMVYGLPEYLTQMVGADVAEKLSVKFTRTTGEKVSRTGFSASLPEELDFSKLAKKTPGLIKLDWHSHFESSFYSERPSPEDHTAAQGASALYWVGRSAPATEGRLFFYDQTSGNKSEPLRSEVRAGAKSTEALFKDAARLTYERHRFVELLHILNRYWWLEQDASDFGRHDKEEMGFRKLDDGSWGFDSRSVFEWGETTFEVKKAYIKKLIQDRMDSGYLNNPQLWNSGDGKRFLDLAATLELSTHWPEELRGSSIPQTENIILFSPALYPLEALPWIVSSFTLGMTVAERRTFRRWLAVLPRSVRLGVSYSASWWKDFLRMTGIRETAGGYASHNEEGDFVFTSLGALSFGLVMHELIHILQFHYGSMRHPLLDEVLAISDQNRSGEFKSLLEGWRAAAFSGEYLPESLGVELAAYLYQVFFEHGKLSSNKKFEFAGDSIWPWTRNLVRALLWGPDRATQAAVLAHLRNYYLRLNPSLPLPPVLQHIEGVDENFSFPEAGWPETSPSMEAGKRMAREIAGSLPESSEEVTALIEHLNQPADPNGSALQSNSKLDVLNQPASFTWKYKEGGFTERGIRQSAPGIEGFLRVFDAYILRNGIVGQWSLAFHAGNQNGQGDVLTYLDDSVRGVPGLESVMSGLEKIAQMTPAAAGLSERIQRDLTAIGFMREVLIFLKGQLEEAPVQQFISQINNQNSMDVKTETLEAFQELSIYARVNSRPDILQKISFHKAEMTNHDRPLIRRLASDFAMLAGMEVLKPEDPLRLEQVKRQLARLAASEVVQPDEIRAKARQHLKVLFAAPSKIVLEEAEKFVVPLLYINRTLQDLRPDSKTSASSPQASSEPDVQKMEGADVPEYQESEFDVRAALLPRWADPEVREISLNDVQQKIDPIVRNVFSAAAGLKMHLEAVGGLARRFAVQAVLGSEAGSGLQLSDVDGYLIAEHGFEASPEEKEIFQRQIAYPFGDVDPEIFKYLWDFADFSINKIVVEETAQGFKMSGPRGVFDEISRRELSIYNAETVRPEMLTQVYVRDALIRILPILATYSVRGFTLKEGTSTEFVSNLLDAWRGLAETDRILIAHDVVKEMKQPYRLGGAEHIASFMESLNASDFLTGVKPATARSEVRGALKLAESPSFAMASEEERERLQKAAFQLAEKIYAMENRPRSVLTMPGSGKWAGQILQAAWQKLHPEVPLEFYDMGGGAVWESERVRLASSSEPLLVLDDAGKTLKAINAARPDLESQFGSKRLTYAVLYAGNFPADPEGFYAGSGFSKESIEGYRESFPFLRGKFIYGEHVNEDVLNQGLPVWHLVRKFGKTGLRDEILIDVLGPLAYRELVESVETARQKALEEGGVRGFQQAKRSAEKAGEDAAEAFLQGWFPQVLQDLTSALPQKASARMSIAQPPLQISQEQAPKVLHDFRNVVAPVYTYAHRLLDPSGLPQDSPNRKILQAFMEMTAPSKLLREKKQSADAEEVIRMLDAYREFASNPKNLEVFRAAFEEIHEPAAYIDGIETMLKGTFRKILEFSGDDPLTVISLRVILDEAALSDISSGEIIKDYQTPENLEIRVRPLKFSRVILNLIRNAKEAMREKGSAGKVYLRTKLSEDGQLMRVTIEIEDEGVGIPEEKLSAIWAPNYTTKVDGTGLGLASVKEIVEQEMKGTIQVHSVLGKGTVFAIQVPPELVSLRKAAVPLTLFSGVADGEDQVSAEHALFFTQAQTFYNQIVKDLKDKNIIQDGELVQGVDKKLWHNAKGALKSMGRAIRDQNKKEFLSQADLFLFLTEHDEHNTEWTAGYENLKKLAGRSEVRIAEKLMQVEPAAVYPGLGRILDVTRVMKILTDASEREELRDRLVRLAATALRHDESTIGALLATPETEGRHFVFADQFGKITGEAQVSTHGSRAELVRLVTVKSEDQIQGRGQALLNQVLQALRHEGFQKMRIMMPESALAFYENYFNARNIPFVRVKPFRSTLLHYSADLSRVSDEALTRVDTREALYSSRSEVRVSEANSDFSAKLLQVPPIFEKPGMGRVLSVEEIIKSYPQEANLIELHRQIIRVAAAAFGFEVPKSVWPIEPEPDSQRFVFVNEDGVVTGYARLVIAGRKTELMELATFKDADKISGRGQVLMNVILQAVRKSGLGRIRFKPSESSKPFYSDYFLQRGISVRKPAPVTEHLMYEANFSKVSDDDLNRVSLRDKPPDTAKSEVRAAPLIVSEKEAERFADDLTELYYLLASAQGGDESLVTMPLISAVLQQLKRGVTDEKKSILLTSTDLLASELKRYSGVAHSEEVIEWMNYMRQTHTEILEQLQVFREPDYSDLVFTPGRGDAVLILGPSMSGKSSLATALQDKDYLLGGESDTGYLMLRIPGYFLMAGAGSKLETIRARAWSNAPDLDDRRVPVQNFGSRIGLVKAVVQLNHPESYKPAGRSRKSRQPFISARWVNDLMAVRDLGEYGPLGEPVLTIHVTHGYVNPEGFRSLANQIDAILRKELNYNSEPGDVIVRSEVRAAADDEVYVLKKNAQELMERLVPGLRDEDRKAMAETFAEKTHLPEQDKKTDVFHQVLSTLVAGFFISVLILYAGFFAALFGYILQLFGLEASSGQLFVRTVGLAAIFVSYAVTVFHKPRMVLSAYSDWHGSHLFLEGDVLAQIKAGDSRVIGYLYHEWTHQLKRAGQIQDDRIASTVQWLRRYELEKKSAAGFIELISHEPEPAGFKGAVRRFWWGFLPKRNAAEFKKGYDAMKQVLSHSNPDRPAWGPIAEQDRFHWSDLFGYHGVQGILGMGLGWENYARSIRLGGMAAAILDEKKKSEEAWAFIRYLSSNSGENAVSALMRIERISKKARSEVRIEKPELPNPGARGSLQDALVDHLTALQRPIVAIDIGSGSDKQGIPKTGFIRTVTDGLRTRSIDVERVMALDLLGLAIVSNHESGEIYYYRRRHEELINRDGSFKNLDLTKPLEPGGGVPVLEERFQKEGQNLAGQFNLVTVIGSDPRALSATLKTAFQAANPEGSVIVFRPTSFGYGPGENQHTFTERFRAQAAREGFESYEFRQSDEDVIPWTYYSNGQDFGLPVILAVKRSRLQSLPLEKRPEVRIADQSQRAEMAESPKDAFTNYYRALRTLMPQDPKQEWTVISAAAGPSVRDLYLSTGFTKAYLLDEIPISLDKLKAAKAELLSSEPSQAHRAILQYRQKRDLNGYADAHLFGDDLEYGLLKELEDLGVSIENVEFSANEKDRARIQIQFELEGETREVEWVTANLLQLPESLKEEFQDKANVYYQKAAHNLPSFYQHYLFSVSQWVRPGGILMLNDVTSGNEFVDSGESLGLIQYDSAWTPTIRQAQEQVERALGITDDSPPRAFYGWHMMLWRKKELSSKRSEVRVDAWYNNPVESVDVGAVAKGLRQVREDMGVIKAELADLEWHHDDLRAWMPDLAFTERVIKQYVQAVKYFNEEVLTAPDMTWQKLKEQFLLLHGKIGRANLIDSAGIILNAADDYEINAVLKYMFSDRFTRRLQNDPVRAAASVFVRLVNIQGFLDGNKRTASFILNYVLTKAGYEPFILTGDNAAEYFHIVMPIRESGRVRFSEFYDFLDRQVRRRSVVRAAELSSKPAKTESELVYKWRVLSMAAVHELRDRPADILKLLELNRKLLGDRDADVLTGIVNRVRRLSAIEEVMKAMPEVLGAKILTGRRADEILNELDSVLEEVSVPDLAQELFGQIVYEGDVVPESAETIANLSSVSLESMLRHLETLLKSVQAGRQTDALENTAYVTASIGFISELLGYVQKLKTQYPEGGTVGLAIAEETHDLGAEQIADQHARALANLSGLINRMIVIGRLPNQFQEMLNQSGFKGIKLTLEGNAQNVKVPDGQARVPVVEVGDSLRGSKIPPEILRVLLGEDGYDMNADTYSFYTISAAVALQYAYSVIAALKLKKEMNPAEISQELLDQLGFKTQSTFVMDGDTMRVMVTAVQSLIAEFQARSEIRTAA